MFAFGNWCKVVRLITEDQHAPVVCHHSIKMHWFASPALSFDNKPLKKCKLWNGRLISFCPSYSRSPGCISGVWIMLKVVFVDKTVLKCLSYLLWAPSLVWKMLSTSNQRFPPEICTWDLQMYLYTCEWEHRCAWWRPGGRGWGLFPTTWLAAAAAIGRACRETGQQGASKGRNLH